MKSAKMTPAASAYLAPQAIELPMVSEECIAISNPSSYTGEDWGDDFDDDND